MRPVALEITAGDFSFAAGHCRIAIRLEALSLVFRRMWGCLASLAKAKELRAGRQSPGPSRANRQWTKGTGLSDARLIGLTQQLNAGR